MTIRREEECFGNISDSQSRLDLDDGSDSICAERIGDGGVLLGGVVTEQEHHLGVEGVSGPGYIRQEAGSCRIGGVVGVLAIDEVDWRGPH